MSDQLVMCLETIEAAIQLKCFLRVSAAEKAKLKNQTSSTIWPFGAIAANPRDPVPHD